jgi:hypothetical protein
VHPLIGEDEFSIEIDEIFDDDFQKVHPIILELRAEAEHVGEVEHMRVDAAEFMRVVLLEALDDGALVVGILEEFGEAVAGLLGGGWVDEGLDEEVVDDLGGLFALAAVDSEYLEEEVLVVREGRLKPADSM